MILMRDFSFFLMTKSNVFVCCVFVCHGAGSGESDAHRWAEATHAAEGFPRHLKRLQSTSIPSFRPALFPAFPSCPLTSAPSCYHPSVHSYRLRPHPCLSPPLFCFSEPAHLLPPRYHSLLSLPVTPHGHRMARLYPTHSHFSFSSSPHVLASERHFPCGFTRWSFSLLIIEGKFWGLFMRRRARSHLFMSGLMMRHYHVQLPSTRYHARLSFSRRKLFWCWNITEKWTWNDGKDFVVDEGIMIDELEYIFD